MLLAANRISGTVLPTPVHAAATAITFQTLIFTLSARVPIAARTPSVPSQAPALLPYPAIATSKCHIAPTKLCTKYGVVITRTSTTQCLFCKYQLIPLTSYFQLKSR